MMQSKTFQLGSTDAAWFPQAAGPLDAHRSTSEWKQEKKSSFRSRVIILRSSVITRKLKRTTRSAFHNPAAAVFVRPHALLFWKLWLRGCTRLARKAVYPPSRQVGVIDFVTKSWWNMSTGATGDQRNSSGEAFIGLLTLLNSVPVRTEVS